MIVWTIQPTCVDLTSVKLGSGVASIEERAFSGGTSLKTITIGKRCVWWSSVSSPAVRR